MSKVNTNDTVEILPVKLLFLVVHWMPDGLLLRRLGVVLLVELVGVIVGEELLLLLEMRARLAHSPGSDLRRSPVAGLHLQHRSRALAPHGVRGGGGRAVPGAEGRDAGPPDAAAAGPAAQRSFGRVKHIRDPPQCPLVTPGMVRFEYRHQPQ